MLNNANLPYSERQDWSDLTPIPQHEPGFTPLCPIMYSNECELTTRFRSISIIVHILSDRDAMDYFRALMQTGERSKRGLELTEHLINLNPAHYSVWCAEFLCRLICQQWPNTIVVGSIVGKPCSRLIRHLKTN